MKLNHRNHRNSLRLTSALVAALIAFFALPTFAAGGVVNINQASAEQLALLPRIGAAVAQRIVEYRKQNGEFKSAADLALVRGIGERTCELIKPYVALSGETTLGEKVRSPRKSTAGSAKPTTR